MKTRKLKKKLEKELDSLGNKMSKLGDMLYNTDRGFYKLRPYDRSLLITQYSAMETYSFVLEARIDALEEA